MIEEWNQTKNNTNTPTGIRCYCERWQTFILSIEECPIFNPESKECPLEPKQINNGKNENEIADYIQWNVANNVSEVVCCSENGCIWDCNGGLNEESLKTQVSKLVYKPTDTSNWRLPNTVSERISLFNAFMSTWCFLNSVWFCTRQVCFSKKVTAPNSIFFCSHLINVSKKQSVTDKYNQSQSKRC